MPRPKTTLKAVKQYWVAYARKSSEEEDRQVHTLEDQEKMHKEYYAQFSQDEKQYPLLLLSEAKSAFHPGRPVFNQIMEMIERGEVHGVMVVQANRISRNPKDSGAFVQKLVEGKITNLDTTIEKRRYNASDSNMILMLMMEGAMSWKDSKDKSVRVGKAMSDRAAEGKHMGRKSFGFKPNPIVVNGKVKRSTAVDDERLPHAITLYHMASTGAYSLRELEAWAALNKVTARPTKKNPSGRLGSSTIAFILHDPYYKGINCFHGKEAAKWTDDPPVSEELWNRVQIAMFGRCTNTARIKEDAIRKLFIFGTEMKCGKCSRSLSPYRVVKKSGKMFVYFECKNPKTHCKVSIPQPLLWNQYVHKLEGLNFGDEELKKVKEQLVILHKTKSESQISQQKRLNADYERVTNEITQQVALLPKAKENGIEDEVWAGLANLKQKKESLSAQLAQSHTDDTQWIDKVIKSFELIKMAEELLKYGSPQIRTAILKAIASNHTIIDGKLVWELRSPFKEAVSRDRLPEWWTILDSNQ